MDRRIACPSVPGSAIAAAADDIVARVVAAASHGNWDAVRLHLQSIDDDHVERDAAVRLIDVAIQHGNARLLQEFLTSGIYDELRQHVPSSTPYRLLHQIVCEGNALVLAALLTTTQVSLSHIQPDALGGANEHVARAPLLIAVEQDNESVIRVLLKHGASPNVSATDASKWTALHLAAEWGNCSVVTQLLRAGANAETRASDGDTPLHIAIRHNHMGVARVLIDAGVDVNARNDTGWTPLHVAAVEGHTSAMTLLLEHGALVDARDESGSTPLHVSAFFDENGARFAKSMDDTQIAVVNLLLASGADTWLCDARGISPAKRAKHERYDVIVDVLQSHLSDRTAPAG